VRDLRIRFLGDSFTAGVGDDTGLGYVGRLIAAAHRRGVAITAYNLGVRRDTGALIRARVEREVTARFEGAGGDGHALILCFGVNDVSEENGAIRVPQTSCLDQARALLGWALPRWPVLWLGPPPALHDAATDARVAALMPLLADLAMELRVPFLPLHATLTRLPEWAAGAARGDGVHPDGAGYAALAALVESWAPWQTLTTTRTPAAPAS
jgi:acyl-CoA thioesterase I